MYLLKILAVSIVLVFSLNISFGQDYVESEDWLSGVSGYKYHSLYHRYKHYTEEDVVRAKTN